eukprot:scaffold93307_cov34-Attheya_sp.AAC.3
MIWVWDRDNNLFPLPEGADKTTNSIFVHKIKAVSVSVSFFTDGMDSLTGQATPVDRRSLCNISHSRNSFICLPF